MKSSVASKVIILNDLHRYKVKIVNIYEKKERYYYVLANGVQEAISTAMSKHPLYKKGLSVGEQMSRFSSFGFHIYEPVRM